MSGVLDRQEVIAVLEAHMVGVGGVRAVAYRERIADALMALAERYVVPADNRSFYRVALLEAAAEQRRLAADARTNNGEAEHTDIADWLEERAGQLTAARVLDPDPTRAAIDVIAREVTEQMLDAMDLGDLWSDYPEIGEDDWRGVVGRARDRAEADKPDVETYKAAYAHLQGRAEAWAEENDPA